MAKVYEDEKGVYITINGAKHRPGPIVGYDHAYNMSDSGIKAGDTINARHVAGTTLCKIKLEDDQELHWANEYEHEKQKMIFF